MFLFERINYYENKENEKTQMFQYKEYNY